MTAKRIISFLLAFVLVFGTLLDAPLLVFADVTTLAQSDVVASGYCGYPQWTLTSDGVLTIHGTGTMKNYASKTAMPWYNYIGQITSVEITSGVKSIGNYAFYGMTKLKTISIPETVTAIGDYAFKGCTALNGVKLPSGLTQLGESAFYGCSALTAIEIPATLWTVKPYTFKNCTALAQVTFHEGNLQKISDGSFYNTALTELVLPDCLDILDVYSFKNCSRLASITLGTGLSEIREAVFYGSAIPHITIPEGVTEIDPYAFKNCVNLETVDLPETLTKVGEAAFYACSSLRTLDLPDAVASIGNYAFRRCASLSSVNFSDSLTTIGESSFYGCYSLTSLAIPSKVTNIMAYAFKGCTDVTSVYLPASLTTLGDSAFHTCTGLKTIAIPANVTSLGEYCFSGSYNLYRISFLGSAPSIGTGAFKGLAVTVRYPDKDSSWVAYGSESYGAKTITWKAVDFAEDQCNHTMESTPYQAPTCTDDGNKAYLHCTTCGKYYDGGDGITEITLASTVIKATGHTVVVDPAVEATETTSGLTEGSHCSVCHMILVAQEVIPPVESGNKIIYYISGSDTYLQKLENTGKIANPNPTTYKAGQTITLSNNIKVDGYTFMGWYDSFGSNATQVKTINSEGGLVELYAHWEKLEYKVTFDSPDIPVESVTYTVDTGVTLEHPSWFGYTFVGWSQDGKIVSSIPVGTTGNITLHANWTSDRNKAKAVSKLEDPIVIEDMDNGQYLFVYEIGTIENVPLDVIQYLGNTQKVEINQKYSYTSKISESMAEQISKSVSNATTKTSAWTLSEDWNSSTQATNEKEESTSKTDATTDSQGNTVDSQYFISNVEGGMTSSSSSSGGSSGTSSKVTSDTSTGINGSYTRENETKTSASLEASASVNASAQVGPAASRYSVSAEISASASTEASASEKAAATLAASRTNNAGTEDVSTSESHWDTSHSSSSSWNSEESYTAATSTSQNKEISKAISEAIHDRYSYTSTENRGGNNSNTQSTGENQELTNEYASTVEYSNETETVTERNITYISEVSGYYRLITAGTMHVFAVVGYDLATNSYYTYTYNVLDSERHEYLDYSKDNANFNDCENAILPFEVPYEVHEYVSRVIAKSSGLEIDHETGIITDYYGTSEFVTIPEYLAVDNGNGYSAIRVLGIAPDAFRGNTDVKGVYLPKYIDTIPERAFQGCTSLQVVMGYGITKIGAGAFSGCSSLKAFTVDKHITELGSDAFKGTPEVIVSAGSEKIADAALASNSKRITLRLNDLAVPFSNRQIVITDDAEYFALLGNGSVYENLQVESDAAETVINNMKFTANTDVPLKFSSDKVTLNRVTVENSPRFALILSGKDVELDLYGTIRLSSVTDKVVLSQGVTLDKENPEVAGKLSLTGNYLTCGTINNSKMLSFNEGELVTISEEEFRNMLTSSVVTFNANGGTVENNQKTVYYGQVYGTLPTPSRESYGFEGWYTGSEGGELVTADTKVTALVAHTLYAHWAPNKFTVTFDPNGGRVDTTSRSLTFGDSYGALPTPVREYHTFDGWFTAAEGGEQVSADTVPGIAQDVTLYAHWTRASYVVSFNANGGTVDTASKVVNYADAYGALPVPTKDYHDFTGWFTAASGGTPITEETIVDLEANTTLYAQWKLKAASGWVLASEVPGSAQVVNTKWTYTQTTTTESKETSLAGYTQIGSRWVQSGSGSFEYSDKFSTYAPGFKTSDSIYTSLNKAPYTSYETATTKRDASTSWAGYVYWHWMYDCGGGGATNRSIYYKNATGTSNLTGNNYGYKYFGAFKSTSNFSKNTSGNWGQNDTYYAWYHVTDRSSYASTQGSYWYYRFDYYKCSYTDYYKMFTYEKVENLESATEITASSTISNVQKWVQYRAK